MKNSQTNPVSDRLLAQLLEQTNDLVVITTADLGSDFGPRIVHVNQSFCDRMGYSAGEIIGESPGILHGIKPDEFVSFVKNATQNVDGRVEMVNYTRSGEPIWLDINIVPLFDSDGNLVYFAAIERDLTEQKKLMDRLRDLSRIDSLTGIANRRFFEFRINQLFYDFKRYEHSFSLIYMDIDNFKDLNDSYGHSAGDTVLKTMATSCKKQLRQGDMIARIGGDEFAVVLKLAVLPDAKTKAEELREMIATLPIDIQQKTTGITASLGVTSALNSDDSPHSLLTRADRALYAAKKRGRDCVQSLEQTSQTDAAG